MKTHTIPAVAQPQQINVMKRREYRWNHPREREIDSAQPEMLTPKGIGNEEQPGGFMPMVW